MPEPKQIFQQIAIASHPEIEEAFQEGDQIQMFLRSYGVHSDHRLLNDEIFHQRIRSGEFDLLIALGGDGTMLRAGRLCAPVGIPVLGVNVGHFGFLTEIRGHQWREFLPSMLRGEYWLEHRMMLWAEQWRGNRMMGAWEALNDVVVCRGKIVRPVKLDANVDGRFLTSYIADGLIVATPTGSTAYALAVGGPILPPESRNILLVPVAPHLSVDRTIVLSEGSEVSITVHTKHQAVLSIDGQIPVDLEDGDRVEVRASHHTVKFIRFQDPGYFYRNLTPHMNQNPITGIIR
mgnify:CR=1 FL=1